MATKQDLQREVNLMNKKYFKSSKNHLVINGAYGGWMVGITGREGKRGKRLKWSSTGLDPVSGQDYHDTASKTLASLRKADMNGSLKRQARKHNKRTRLRAKLHRWYVD